MWSRYQNLVQAGFLILLRIQKTNKTFSPVNTKPVVDNVGQFWLKWPKNGQNIEILTFQVTLCRCDCSVIQKCTLKCKNLNNLTIFGHFCQNWPILSITDLVLAGEKDLLVFWILKRIKNPAWTKFWNLDQSVNQILREIDFGNHIVNI